MSGAFELNSETDQPVSVNTPIQAGIFGSNFPMPKRGVPDQVYAFGIGSLLLLGLVALLTRRRGT